MCPSPAEFNDAVNSGLAYACDSARTWAKSVKMGKSGVVVGPPAKATPLTILVVACRVEWRNLRVVECSRNAAFEGAVSSVPRHERATPRGHGQNLLNVVTEGEVTSLCPFFAQTYRYEADCALICKP